MHGDNGIIDVSSNHSSDRTVDKLKSILRLKEITLFIVIDHSGEAAKVGLEMRSHPTADLWQPQGRNASYACHSQHRP